MDAQFDLKSATYGAVGDGVTDDTVAVERWLSDIAAAADNAKFLPAIGDVPAGTYRVTRPLRMPVRNNWAIIGQGRYLSSFAYAGADLADAHIFEIGDESRNSTAVQIRGLSVFALVDMSASFALKANRLANSSLGDVAFGGEDYNYRYGAVRTANGVWLNGAHQVFLSEFDCRTKGDGIRVNAIDLSSCNDLYIDQGLSSGNGACGLRCAGGFGGLYLDQVVLLANAEANLIVDSSEAHRIEDPNNRNNREIILGANTVCDGNSWRTPHCIVLDDANANGSGLVCHGYVGSAGQHGVYVKRWANSSVVLAAGRNYNNHGSAVVVDDERCRLVIGSGVSLDNNREPIRNAGGWGGGEWTRVPVRVSATQGRFYSADATVRYSVTGSTVHFTGVVNITINGSAAGGVVITLPVRAFADGSFPAVCTGRADAVSGVMLQGVIRGDSLILLSYDNSYPGGDGERLVFGGTYEVASLNW